MGEDTILEVGLVPPEMFTYFRALLKVDKLMEYV